MIVRHTLRSQARDILLEQILEGELVPGQSINVSELAGQLGISRTPLREALLSLAEQGLVGIGTGNKSFYVWPLTLAEAKNLGEISQALESLAVRTTEFISEERIQDLRMINEKLAQVHGKPTLMIKWDDRWHDALISGSENGELRELVQLMRNRFYRYRWYGYDYVVLHGSDEKLQSIEQHAAITDTLEARDFDRAAELVEEHWRIGIQLLAEWLPKTDHFQLRD